MQVENVRNKEKQAKPSQQVQTEITAEDIFLRTEDEIAANTLIDIHHQSQIQSVEESDTNVQQLQETNIRSNLPTKQLVSIPYQEDTNLQQFTETNVARNIQTGQILSITDQSNLIPDCVQNIGLTPVVQQYLGQTLPRRQLQTATVSRAPDETNDMFQQSAILSDLDSLINADIDQVTEEQNEDHILEQQSKKRNIDESSTSSPKPKKQKNKNKFKCECGNSYTRQYDLQHHKINRCGKANEKGEFECDACGLNFVKRNTYREHITRVHLKEEPYECIKCGENFWNNSTFYRHKSSKHPRETFPKKKW